MIQAHHANINKKKIILDKLSIYRKSFEASFMVPSMPVGTDFASR